jgi:CNT family concentrative nucleoside transporter
MPWLQLQSAFGLCALVAIAWSLSENRRTALSVRLIAVALGLQIGLALLLLEVPPARNALYSLNVVVDVLSRATQTGSSFVFGYVGGGEPPFAVTNPQNAYSLAFQALPLLLVMSALSALLWHWGVLQVIVRGISYALQKSLGIGGAVGLGAASNVFLGMIESPLLIRPYLSKLSRAELFMLFTVGLATVAGTVIEPVVPGALGHILVASFISLPASILVAHLMVPGESTTDAEAHLAVEYSSSMDAIAKGTEDGLKLYLGVVAMLLVMVALVALVNIVIAGLPEVNGAPLTVQRIFGWLFSPIVWLYGVPMAEASNAGALLGTKTILNEFIAYLDLAALPPDALSERSRLIMVYAMCGFANLGSVGIMIAGVSAMIPERRAEVVELSLKSLISGTIASGMTGAVVGLLPSLS